MKKQAMYALAFFFMGGLAFTNIAYAKTKACSYSTVLSVGTKNMKQWALDGLDKMELYNVSGYIKALKDKDSDVQAHALSSLGRLGSKAQKAVPKMVPCLRDPKPEIRGRTCRVLVDILEKCAYKVFPAVDLLSANDRGIQKYRHDKNYVLKDQVVDEIARRLYDKDEYVREAAATSLFRLGPNSLTEYAAQAFDEARYDPSHRVRFWAFLSYGEIYESCGSGKTNKAGIGACC